jgi:hypothetical protein
MSGSKSPASDDGLFEPRTAEGKSSYRAPMFHHVRELTQALTISFVYAQYRTGCIIGPTEIELSLESICRGYLSEEARKSERST